MVVQARSCDARESAKGAYDSLFAWLNNVDPGDQPKDEDRGDNGKIDESAIAHQPLKKSVAKFLVGNTFT